MLSNCSNCTYPNAVTVQTTADCMVARFSDNLVGHQILPMTDIGTARYKLMNLSESISGGIAPARGQDKRLAITPYILKGNETTISPAHYGEQIPVPAEFMQPEDGCKTISIQNPVSEITRIAAERLAAARERAIWLALTTGQYTAVDNSGMPLYHYEYLIHQPQLAVTWDDPMTAAPLHDLMCILSNLPRCCSWDQRSRMYMNSNTLNCLIFNQNGNDLNMSGCCERGWDHLTDTLERYRMPQIEVYDGQYKDRYGVAEFYIPNGFIVFVGYDGGETVGNYMRMWSEGPCDSGPMDHVWVDDSCERQSFPRKISVNSATAGAPVIKKPSCVASLFTGCTGLDC